MTTTTIGSKLAALVAGTMLLGGVAWADVTGTVTSVGHGEIIVSGAVYKIGVDTSIEDLGGERVALSELRPGTPVELVLDDAGHLVTVRANLVR